MKQDERERLYQELMLILQYLEERNINTAGMHLEGLIEKVKFNQI